MPTPASVDHTRRKVTVICLHSSASSGAQWATLRAHLEPEAGVLTPDFHGHGTGPAWHGFAEDIVAADAARIARLVETCAGGAHLVGHSYGGALALRVALYHPENVVSVTAYEPVLFRALFDCHGRRPPASEIIRLTGEVRRRLRAGDAPGAAARFVEYWGGTGAWPALSTGQREAIANRMPTVAAHFVALANDAPRLADYRRLRVPTLLLFGSRTRAPMRRIGELLQPALASATLETMTPLGHMGPITHANAFAQRVARFVRGQRPGARPDPRELAA